MSATGKSFLIWIFLAFSLNAQTNTPSPIPHLEEQGATKQLIVDGKPFLMLAGETGNSSASDLKYLDAIWPKVMQMNLNTLLVPVYWDLIEPSEGKLDFTLVDGAINGARKNNIRLVFYGSEPGKTACPVMLRCGSKQIRRDFRVLGMRRVGHRKS